MSQAQETTRQQKTPRRCESCDKHIAQVMVLPYHKYYMPGGVEDTTVDRDAQMNLCFLCAEALMDWDNGDLYSAEYRDESALGKDLPAPHRTIVDMHYVEPCHQCGKNFGQVCVRNVIQHEIRFKVKTSQILDQKHLCFACAGVAGDGWSEREGTDIAVPENWAEICAQKKAKDANMPF